MSFGNFFWTKTSVALFISFKTKGNIAKEAIKAHFIDVRMTSVSNYRYSITNSSNWIPVIGHPRDRAPITWLIETITKFSNVIGYQQPDLSINWTVYALCL